VHHDAVGIFPRHVSLPALYHPRSGRVKCRGKGRCSTLAHRGRLRDVRRQVAGSVSVQLARMFYSVRSACKTYTVPVSHRNSYNSHDGPPCAC
jgi:hypothetical protein